VVQRLRLECTRSVLPEKCPDHPTPRFFVNVDSKQFNYPVSHLDATLAGDLVGVDSNKLASKHNSSRPRISFGEPMSEDYEKSTLIHIALAHFNGLSSGEKGIARTIQKNKNGSQWLPFPGAFPR